MKFFAVFLLFAAIFTVSVVPGSVQTKSLRDRLIQRIRDFIEMRRQARNQWIIDSIKRERENFSTGWPELGIPPIDPLYIEKVELEIDSIGTLAAIDFRFFDAYLRGLQLFEIKTFDLRILGLSVEFAVSFKLLVFDGQHSTRANLAGSSINGAGTISMVFNDVEVRGKFDIGTITGGYLNLHQAELRVNVGTVNANLRGFGILLDPVINLLLSVGIPVLINDSSDRINEIVAETFIPAVNEVLNQYRVIDLILAIIPRIYLNVPAQELKRFTEIIEYEYNALEKPLLNDTIMLP